MATELENTVEYYKDLLLYQYINKPKARAVIGLLCEQALVDLLPIAINDSFDINTAVGKQLEILGEYIGISRSINTIVGRDYFTFDDNVNPAAEVFGFTDYTDPALNATVETYAYINYNTSSLTDVEYRIFLQLKALLNTSTNNLSDINKFLFDFFGTNLILCDQADMTISYFVNPEISRIIAIASEQNLLPKPMGVLICGVFESSDPLSIWGFSDYTVDNGLSIGFSDYETGSSNGTFLSYLDRI